VLAPPRLPSAPRPSQPPPPTTLNPPPPTTLLHTASLGGAPANNEEAGLLPTTSAAAAAAPAAGEDGGGAGPAPLGSSPPQQQPQPYYTAGAAFLTRNSFRHGALRQTLSIRAGGGGAGSGGVEAAAASALAAHDEEHQHAAAGRPSSEPLLAAAARPKSAAHGSEPLGLKTDLLALKEIVFGSWLNLLLVCVPLGIMADPVFGWGATATFALNFFALVPLALILGDITEDLAVRFGDTIGGLINATFGNVVEIILSVAALQQGLYQVVAMSLLGSILSNLLLVLGCCFIFGGLYYKQQEFNAVANQASSSLLFLSCIGVVLPTAAAHLAPAGAKKMSAADVLVVSRGAAVVLLGIYIAYLTFQLHTHNHLFGSGDDDGEPVLTLPGAFLALAAVTGCVAVCSEFLTGSIEAFSEQTHMSQAFVGLIVLPIAGNAAEHVVS
jgi:calcium/proton exchanger cax